MREQKGITIITLAITIIILGILASISINLLVGDNGVITSTRNAKENIEMTQAQEKERVNQLYEQLTGYDAQFNPNVGTVIEKLENEIVKFKKIIAEAIEEAGGVETSETAEASEMATNIKGIVQEVTKDATATEEDIAKDKTAYVKGELITGIASFGEIILDSEMSDSYTSTGSSSSTSITATDLKKGKYYLCYNHNSTNTPSVTVTLNDISIYESITVNSYSRAGARYRYGSGIFDVEEDNSTLYFFVKGSGTTGNYTQLVLSLIKIE